jgi:large subunit ribosomal protein L22
MQAMAKMNYARVSPQKARLVVDQIRGRSVGEALTILRMTNKRVAPQIEKVLRSAMANAENNNEADVDELFVKEAYVNEGPRLKRLRPAPMGRAHRYLHRLSHIIVVVSDGQEEVAEEPQEE